MSIPSRKVGTYIQNIAISLHNSIYKLEVYITLFLKEKCALKLEDVNVRVEIESLLLLLIFII